METWGDLLSLSLHIKGSFEASIQRLEKHEGRLITANRNDPDNLKNNRMTITRKQK